MKPTPAKPRIIIAQVEGSGTADARGATTSIEKELPLLSRKNARGSSKREALVNICRFALCCPAIRVLPKTNVIWSPSSDLLTLVAATPFAPDPPHPEIPHNFTKVSKVEYPGIMN
jgi:hypothetical protein